MLRQELVIASSSHLPVIPSSEKYPVKRLLPCLPLPPQPQESRLPSPRKAASPALRIHQTLSEHWLYTKHHKMPGKQGGQDPDRVLKDVHVL